MVIIVVVIIITMKTIITIIIIIILQVGNKVQYESERAVIIELTFA